MQLRVVTHTHTDTTPRPQGRRSAVLGTLSRPRATYRFGLRARPFDLISGAILRFGLVLFLLLFGLAKFTQAEAETIQPWIAHSPFLGWLYSIASVEGASAIIGVLELTIAALLSVRHWSPGVSVIGSLGASVTFLITLSFLFTTPDLSAE